jgi:hypothetical protein
MISRARVIFVGTAPRAAVGESTVDDDGRQAADAVTTGRHRDSGIVHVTNFYIVLGTCQKLLGIGPADHEGKPKPPTILRLSRARRAAQRTR